MIQVKIPFLAEGVESGVVVSILFKEGDQVKKDDTLLELETNKATAPIPSPGAGRIAKIMVKEGAEVQVGQVVMSLEELSGAGGKTAEPAQATPQKTIQKPIVQTVVQPAAQQGEYRYESKSGLPPPASPTIRKMAQQLGIDLYRVKGSENGGRITQEDLKTYIRNLETRTSAPASGAWQKPKAISIDFSKWGPVEKKPLTQIRKVIAQRMQESWTTIPHVTQFEEADITDLLALRKKYVPTFEAKGAKLTVTGIVLKVLVRLLKKYPKFNASFDEAANELVEKHYYHLGVAVDTDQGLIVPVLKDVDKKDLAQISLELAGLAEKARQRKISMDDIQGGTFTLSNLGGIGGLHFTPIVNKPELAILGLGSGILKPVVKNGKTEIRTMLPLCLSYDHRIIDGADGAHFIFDLVQALEQVNESEFKLNESKTVSSRNKK